MKIIPDAAAALVTGAGRGIGRSIALMLAKRNRPQVLLARSADQLEAVAAQIREITAARVLAIPCDVAADDALHEAVDRGRSALGPIRLLINNAGVFLDKPLAETGPEEFRRILNVNTTAPFLLARMLYPDMRDAGGGILVNIASNAGLNPYARQGAYCASKHALLGWAKVFALEARPDNIRVHNICPGGVDTKLIAGTALAERIKGQTVIAPDDIADLVGFLISQPGNLDLPEIVVRRFNQ